ncbi:hypothetical protein N665_0197s0038 [Sinapis alba]|nr:hypothetical protein N665_0197s0038 [Sinapis alba]
MVKQRRMNELPDELVLKILSMIPPFKESVATRLISNQHEDPYKLVPDVTFEDNNEESLVTFMSFVYGSLLSDDDQTLQRLHLKLVRNYSASKINFWVQAAVNRSVRKLRFDLSRKTLKLPGCLSSCTTLKSLILHEVSIKVVPLGFSLPSLKSLHVFSVYFSRTESISSILRGCPVLEYLVLHETCYYYPEDVCLSLLKSLHLLSAWSLPCTSLTRLLQSCPVLEYLVVSQTERDYSIPIMFSVIPPESCLLSIKSLHLSSVQFLGDEYVAKLLKRCLALEDLAISRTRYYDKVRLYNISVPTLKRLTINNTREKHTNNDYKENHGFWINAPALKTLNIKDTVSNFLMLEFMPEVTKANIEVTCDQSEKFIGSLTSVQHLSLCSRTSETPYRSGSVFPYLEHVELCTCSAGWANLLASILSDSPRLHSLTLKSNHSVPYNDTMNFWNEPAVVPECLLMHLEIFEWRQYEDTVQQGKVAEYILANATCLKMATFSTRYRDKDHGMLMEIKKLNRVSEACQLVFE